MHLPVSLLLFDQKSPTTSPPDRVANACQIDHPRPAWLYRATRNVQSEKDSLPVGVTFHSEHEVLYVVHRQFLTVGRVLCPCQRVPGEVQ